MNSEEVIKELEKREDFEFWTETVRIKEVLRLQAQEIFKDLIDQCELCPGSDGPFLGLKKKWCGE